MTAHSKPLAKGDHLYLVDGSGYLFRAYHALPPLTRKSDGLPVGAVSGYCNMMWKLLQDMKGWEAPTHFAVVFDKSEVTFRNKLYSEYKAHRPPAPDDLIPQFPLVRDATRAFGVSCVEQEGFEADDLIATYARLAREAGARVTIVSSDKDLMQLVEDGVVQLLDTMKNKRIGAAEVMEKFGVPPSKVIDVQALAGDSVDNVPGVRGIGVKTAAELINEYGDLETLLMRAGEIRQPKRRESLIEQAENARISKQLVTLDPNATLPEPPDAFAVHEPDPETLLPFLKALEFSALTKRVATRFGVDEEGIAPAVEPSATAGNLVVKHVAEDTPEPRPSAVGAVFERAAIVKPIDLDAYEAVLAPQQLDRWIANIREAGRMAIAIETSGADQMTAPLCGLAIAIAPQEACYVPCGHRKSEGLQLSGDDLVQMSEADVLARLKPLLEDPSILKIGQDAKSDYVMFRQRGIRVGPYDDVMLMSYVLDGGRHGHTTEELAQLHLTHKTIPLAELTGKGKDRKTFDCVPIPHATRYAAEEVDVTLRVYLLLKGRLPAERQTSVYETLERPLVSVLGDMERAGITIDPELLRRLSNDFATLQAAMEKDIHALAGQEFNIGSPKQLGDILFDKFKLDGGRRTKTGAWSTDSDVLEDVAAQGQPIAKKVLDWRGLSKLRGTYTDALPGYVNPTTGRVHTRYSMAATSTGRLASTDPNLQNIPIRTEEGRRIRQAFIASPGCKLISADYSQIELRLLAHMADIPQLKKAFAEELDIHAMTASEMFGVPVEGMPRDVRSRAKAINFGIIYGISAFGLANQLGIGRGEADDYIKKYFIRFPGIRDYMEATKRFARDNGYVSTLFGRRVYIADIASRVPAMRAAAERQAINAPIQGAAADIIRRAMARLPDALAKAAPNATMLLQVHDELIFEAPDAEVEETRAVAKAVMERAAEPLVKLSIPLTVDARAAQNWDAAH